MSMHHKNMKEERMDLRQHTLRVGGPTSLCDRGFGDKDPEKERGSVTTPRNPGQERWLSIALATDRPLQPRRQPSTQGKQLENITSRTRKHSPSKETFLFGKGKDWRSRDGSRDLGESQRAGLDGISRDLRDPENQ